LQRGWLAGSSYLPSYTSIDSRTVINNHSLIPCELQRDFGRAMRSHSYWLVIVNKLEITL
jgi:hypothetical protein